MVKSNKQLRARIQGERKRQKDRKREMMDPLSSLEGTTD